MRTIVVDNEENSVKTFIYESQNIDEIEIVGTFCDGDDAVDYLGDNDAELAVIAVNPDGVDGTFLGPIIKKVVPNIMIIYIAGVAGYNMETIKLNAVAYLFKPYSTGQLRDAVESAKLLANKHKKEIYARTFGNFDLFVNGRPIMFKSAKAKELLAILIDRRGGTVTTDQIICTLWEDRPNDVATQNLCSKICKKLMNELKEYGIEDILISSRGAKSLDTDKFECDLYEFLDGKRELTDKYFGEYMMQYSWAEPRAAVLDRYANELTAG